MQAEFNFQGPNNDGYAAWQQTRKQALLELGRSLGLPVGHPCEVWLKGQVRLRGLLQLKEDLLVHQTETFSNTTLEIGGVPFRPHEIESCVRIG